MKWGTDWPTKRDMSSLRLLGSVGEPINPEAWVWYHRYIGGERCPVVDTWWQTETGAIMITPLPGITTTKPGSATRPFPGIKAEIKNDKGESLEGAGGGLLTLTRPWPAMLRGIYGDPDRYVKQYWSRWTPDIYFTGDGAKRDLDGFYWLLGRVDDVLNVAGHRIGTMEVESALVDHPRVAEAAVVGRPHEIKGQAVAAFVTLKKGCLAAKRWWPSSASTLARRSGRSPSRTTSSSRRISRRPDPAKSCDGCCVTSPKGRRSATRRRWPTRRWWPG
jgi:acetyl-CoA synthetase